VVALVLAGAIQAVLVLHSPAINRDGMTFINMARRLAVSPFATIRGYDQHAGYPGLVLAAHWLVRWVPGVDDLSAWILGGRLVSGMSGLLCVGLVWLMAWRAIGESAAGVAAVLFAVLPLFRENAADVMSDTPHLFFYLLAAWLATEGIQRRRGFPWFPAAGAASGAAYWVRPEGSSVALVGAAVVLSLVARGRLPGRHVVWAGAILVAALAVGLPYAALKGRFAGKKSLSAVVSGTQAMDQVRGGPPHSSMRQAAPPAPIRLRAVLRRLARGVLDMAGEFSHTMRYVMLVPLAVGLLWPDAPRAGGVWRLMAGALCAFHGALLLGLYLIAGYLSGRHTMEWTALGMPWVGAGLLYAADRARGRLPDNLATRLGRGGTIMMLTGVLVLPLLPRAVRPLHWRRIPFVEAARWVRAHSGPSDCVLTNSPYVAFYAQRRGLSPTSLDTIQAAAGGESRLSCRFVVPDIAADDFREKWRQVLTRRYKEVRIPLGAKGRERVLVMVEEGTVVPRGEGP